VPAVIKKTATTFNVQTESVYNWGEEEELNLSDTNKAVLIFKWSKLIT